MQKKLVLAAAVAGALAAPTVMADVKLYGLLDIGLQSVDPGDGYDGADMFVGDNMGAGGSRLGFSASEDLGGGLRALATMEMGWNTDTGQLDNPGPGPSANPDPTTVPDKIFQRQVFAGLGGGWGTLTVGRQYRETFLVGAASSYNYTASGIGVFWLNTNTGVRQDNHIKYTSPTIGGGLTIAASYAPGEGTNAGGLDEENGKFQEVAAKWRSGPLSVNAAFGTSTADTVALNPVDTDITIVGATYAFGPATVYALYSATEADGGAEVDAISLTGKYRVGNGDIVVALGQRSVDPTPDADSTLIGLGYFHWLSKTTNLFFTYGSIDNDDGAALGAPRQIVGTTGGGEDPTVIAVGWVQRF